MTEAYGSYTATLFTLARVYDIAAQYARFAKYGAWTKKERKLARKLGRTSLPWRA